MARARLLDQIVGRLSLKEMKELTEIMISFGASIRSAGQAVLRPLPVVVQALRRGLTSTIISAAPQ
jgi:hypothetical protein